MNIFSFILCKKNKYYLKNIYSNLAKKILWDWMWMGSGGGTSLRQSK